MEERTARIIESAAGGTAGKDAKTYKISLPTKWVNSLDLSDGQAVLTFDGEKIVIAPKLTLNEFINKKTESAHNLLLMQFYDGDALCTEICADFTDKSISAKNYTENIVKTAFGNNKTPTWQDFENFLEERCVPRSRSGIREYLEAIGVEEYDPLEIIKKTNGKMAEDNQWLNLETL